MKKTLRFSISHPLPSLHTLPFPTYPLLKKAATKRHLTFLKPWCSKERRTLASSNYWSPTLKCLLPRWLSKPIPPPPPPSPPMPPLPNYQARRGREINKGRMCPRKVRLLLPKSSNPKKGQKSLKGHKGRPRLREELSRSTRCSWFLKRDLAMVCPLFHLLY